MTLPAQRLTITLAEYRFLKLGLNVLAKALATAKEGHVPHRHPWHLIDNVASDVFRNQAFDDEMASRILRVRGKLWDMTQSRKVYVDAFELSALALSLRLCRSQKSVDVIESSSAEIELLQTKLETYRKRAKRSATARVGAADYRSIAIRWRRFVDWTRYNCLYLALPKRGAAKRANLWKDQRDQLAGLIRKVLADRFYEAPCDGEMSRLVTLATTSLRRSRYSVGLRDLLRSPQAHTDFLADFAEKRLRLKSLPGAPLPVWQAISDRGDKFREFQEKTRGKVSIPADLCSGDITVSEPKHRATVPLKAKASRPYTHNRQALTGEILVEVLATWLYQELTVKFDFTQEVCRQAQHQITCDLLDRYRVTTAATSLNGVVQEMRPTDTPTDTPEIINNYADWLLKILLVLRQQPAWMYQVIGVIGGRAMKLQKEARYDKLSNGSPRDPVGA